MLNSRAGATGLFVAFSLANEQLVERSFRCSRCIGIFIREKSSSGDQIVFPRTCESWPMVLGILDEYNLCLGGGSRTHYAVLFHKKSESASD